MGKSKRCPYCESDLEWLLDGLQNWYDTEAILEKTTYVDEKTGVRYWREDMSEDAIYVVCNQNVAV